MSETMFEDDSDDMSNRLLDFIKDTSDIWDINYTDVRDWIMYNRGNLIEIIK